jgi:hypothetical protein
VMIREFWGAVQNAPNLGLVYFSSLVVIHGPLFVGEV